MTEEETELTRLWSEAVDEYSKKMGREFDAERLRERASSSDGIEALIEEHKSGFSKFRSSHGKTISVFSSVTKHIRNLSKIAQAGIGLTPFAPASIIIEAACFLIDASSAVTDTYDTLETLFRKIQSFVDRLEEYLKGTIDEKLRNVIMNILCSLLGIFCEAEAAIRRGRGKEMMRRVVGKENKVQNALDHLEQILETELGLVIAKTYGTTQRIDEKMDINRDQELLDKALSANVSDDMRRLYVEIEESRLPLSGEWLLNQQLFRRWVEMKFPVLWILGKPGTGKTYLASRVITYLRESQLHPRHGYVGYFYIRETMQTQYTPSIVLTSIASQITKESDAYSKRATAVCKDGSSLFSPTLIWNALFVDYFSKETSRPLFIIIDGVDESLPEHQNLLLMMAKQLSDLRAQSKYPCIQILLLGRPDIEYVLSNVWANSKKRPKVIQIQSSKSQADMDQFICTGVDNISLLQKMLRSQRRSIRHQAKDLRKEIIMRLRQTADGMFMLAKLMLAEIKDMNKPELIQDALNNPPKGLDDMFRRVITKLAVMGGFDKRDLNEILMWVACAKRDLLLSEIDMIIKLRDIQQNGIYALEDELRTRFGSFFTISSSADVEGSTENDDESVPDEYSEDLPADSNDWTDTDGESNCDDEDSESDIPRSFFVTTVKFSHASVRQHFRTQGFYEGIGMDLNSARVHILETCLMFLTNHIPKKIGNRWSPPGLGYSADHFLDHLTEVNIEALKSSQPEKFNDISDEIVFLFRNSGVLDRWYSEVSDKQRLISQLFDKSNVCSCIQEWIPENTSLARFRRPEIRWLRQAKSKAQVLLRPFAQLVAKSWFALNLTDSLVALVLLDGYMSMDAGSPPQWVSDLQRPVKQITERIPPERIRQLASYSQLKRSLGWHLHLGATLSAIGTPQHLLEAVREFRRARRKHGEGWKVYYEEARGLYALQRYQEAIKAASYAFQQERSAPLHEKLSLLKLVRESNFHLRNFEDAITAAKDACILSPWSEDSAFCMINTYHRARRFSDSVQYIKSITNNKSLLVSLMSNTDYIVGQLISTACVESGQIDFARDTFAAASAEAEVSGDTSGAQHAKMALAELYFRYYNDEDRAIESWESIAETGQETNIGIRTLCTLTSLYYTKATEANDKEPWNNKLRMLEEKLKRGLDKRLSLLTSYERICSRDALALLGRWYSEEGNMEQARSLIGPLVKVAVDDLTDRDDANDHNAYSTLAKALLAFGDRENAVIAWAFTKPLQKSNELQEMEMRQSGSSSPMAEVQETVGHVNGTTERGTAGGDPFILGAFCDGLCGRREVDFRSYSMCEICIDLGFCDECLQKHKDGNFPYRICNRKHPFVEIYPPKGLVTKVEGEYRVLSKGKLIGVDEWLKTTSRRWLCE